MNGRTLAREARLRAGLTQSELAERVGTTQPAIARLEAGTTSPSLARLDLIVRACGYALAIELDQDGVDPDEWQRAVRNVSLSPDQRARNLLGAARFLVSARQAKSR